MTAACPRLGFTLRLSPHASLSDAARAALRAALAQALDRLGLEANATSDHAAPWSCVVTRVGSQTAEPDRDAIRAWAAARADVAVCDVGPLLDLDA